MTKSKPFIRRLTLASTSPFRKKLLEDAGVSFEVAAAAGDEKSIAGLPPPLLAAKRAEFKAIDVARRTGPDHVVIGADQVLSLNGVSFDKAESPDEAFARLKDFQGKTHYLHSAICLVDVHHSGSLETVFETVVDIPMTMRPLTDDEIKDYVATGEWQGCVGCYRIEGKGRNLFSNIGGDHSAIIGLPIKELQKALAAHQ
jgi:septum formation protein